MYRQIQKAKSIVVRYDEPAKPHFNKPNDICLDVIIEKIKKDGTPYDYPFIISGNFNFNNDKNPWGSAFKIEKFFQVCGINTKSIGSDMKIPDSWLDQAMGQPFSYISYATTNLNNDGKPYWNDFDIVMYPNEEQKHKDEFMKQVSDGWVKNYDDGKEKVKTESKPEPQLQEAVTDDIDF